MKNVVTLCLFATAFLLTPRSPAAVWDDFQSYAQFEKLAGGYLPQEGSASRWGRFGAATADNPVAMGGFGPAGETVGDYPLVWSLGNNGNLVYHFPTPTNLTATPGFSIQLMSPYEAPTNTSILAVFQDASGTIWQTTPANAQYLQTEYVWQTNQFLFSPALMERVDGAGSFDLSSISNIRIRFVNQTGEAISQHIYFFDFRSLPALTVLQTPVLGPGSSITISFSAEEGPAEAFVLESRTSLTGAGDWAPDTSATIQSLGDGKFQAVTTRGTAPAQFYRIKRP